MDKMHPIIIATLSFLGIIRLGTGVTLDISYSSQSVVLGRTYAMRCGVSDSVNNPRPTLHWKVDNEDPELPKFVVTSNGDLLIQNVTFEDGQRLYTCGFFRDNHTMNITLTVKTRPKLLPGDLMDVYWADLGEWANLTCAVHAFPPARFGWMHGLRTLQPNDETIFLNPEDNISILQVLVRNEARFGQYSCSARNELGHMMKNMTLHPSNTPGVPSLEMGSISNDSAFIRVSGIIAPAKGGRQGKAFPVVGYEVQLKELESGGNWQEGNETNTDDGFLLRGLKPGTRYGIRAAAKSLSKTGDYSEDVTFITFGTSQMETEETKLPCKFQSDMRKIMASIATQLETLRLKVEEAIGGGKGLMDPCNWRSLNSSTI